MPRLSLVGDNKYQRWFEEFKPMNWIHIHQTGEGTWTMEFSLPDMRGVVEAGSWLKLRQQAERFGKRPLLTWQCGPGGELWCKL